MLQPAQLQDVAARYADEITEIRSFLSRTGLALGTAEALPAMADRLQRDRSFHRDLTSHIWVVIDSRGREIRPADLLGILAIAAVGVRFASSAQEDAAHDLLRFLLEARRSLAGPSPAGSNQAPPTLAVPQSPEPAGRPIAVVRSTLSPMPIRPAEPSPAPKRSEQPMHDVVVHPRVVESLPSESAEASSGDQRSYTPWVVAALCLLAALLAGLWLRSRHSAENIPIATAAAPAPAKEAAAGAGTDDMRTVVVEEPAANPTVRQAPAPGESQHPAPIERVPPVTRSSPGTPSSAPAPYPSQTRSASPAATTPLTATVTPPATGNPRLSAPLIAPGAAAPRPAVPPIPASVLSSHLGTPSVPAYAAEDRDRSGHPRLLRRKPPTSLVAEVQPGDAPSMSGSSSAGKAATLQGTVHPTVLGIMAGNVLYSPAPVYPAAASAAHVQGEVKVSSMVDRNGNVAEAHVISGPPLLRDAALDAVQQWRYRPWKAAGKPVPMTATAVLEFQLP